jgi:endonuclease/exonuclease/phosphatase (EEP) superfamily protein YafD
MVTANALTPVLYLPAWPATVVAAGRRRGALFALAAVVVAAHVGFLLPEALAYRPVSTVPTGAIRLRVFDANVFAGNGRLATFAGEVRRARPDIVVLEEASPGDTAVLQAHHALDGLAFRAGVDREDPFGFSIASRFPLEEVDVRTSQGLPVLVRATVLVGGRRARLWAVHTAAPVGPGGERWAHQLADLRRWLGEEHGPLLVAGDLNATWGHAELRDLLRSGRLSDGAAARGSPWAMTWRRGRWLPPLVRIDHILTRGGAEVTAIRTGQGAGSDHRPLIADVAVLPAAANAGRR